MSNDPGHDPMKRAESRRVRDLVDETLAAEGRAPSVGEHSPSAVFSAPGLAVALSWRVALPLAPSPCDSWRLASL